MRACVPHHTHEGERGEWCVHSPLACATHAKMFGKLLPLLLAIKSPFLAIFVVCVCVCLQLTNCQVATHFNSIPTTQLLPRLRAPLPLTRKVTRKYNRLFLHFFSPSPIFRLVYRATRERNVLHIKFIATQLSQARCVEAPQMQAH